MSARRLALVVEDSEDQAALLRRHLEREGFEVFVAKDAETAIGAFDGIEPVIAVLDLLLPGISVRSARVSCSGASPSASS